MVGLSGGIDSSVVAALCTYAIGYRFYSKWIAAKALVLDDRRAPPAEVHDDGRDFVKTNKFVLFGHHFASISGPGPLVGPVLAAQFGYLPGTLWIMIGAILGGAVQDFVILFASVRRDGKSLAEMVREEVGGAAGTNWVFRDESAHMAFAFEVLRTVRRDQPELFDDEWAAAVRGMVAEAVDCESQFADDVLSGGVVGMTRAEMRQYLEYVADQRLAMLQTNRPIVVFGCAHGAALAPLAQVFQLQILPALRRLGVVS